MNAVEEGDATGLKQPKALQAKRADEMI